MRRLGSWNSGTGDNTEKLFFAATYGTILDLNASFQDPSEIQCDQIWQNFVALAKS